ncbi:DUF4145 domain-containing protein [uncultured Hyphomonas sp.]|uniref:DUF4145 domain-containing protein n=1 Tax=uncultured Hyphomonas sp. TaxID=225298 RepID=UPI00374A0273
MAQTITLDCPWCGSKKQTMDIFCVVDARLSPPGLYANTGEARTLSVKCRSCEGLSVATVDFTAGNSSRVAVGNSGDTTKYIDYVVFQIPEKIGYVSENWPEAVRESMLDAYEGRSPRAKCQSYRSAVEFGLREAGITAEAGQTLGAILSEAKKKFALSEPLIELCDQIKAFGNWGLHWAETDFAPEDAEAAQEITQSILSYLFEMPARVELAKKRSDEAKAAHHAPKDNP